jgi:hypothetical protein
MWIAIPFAAAVLSFSIPSQAQQAGLVNVDLRNAKILSNIANHLNVNISNVPITVLGSFSPLTCTASGSVAARM